MSKTFKTFDEEIAAYIRGNEESGDIRTAPSWGKPLPVDEGYADTPEELKMGYKILKDAGVVPAEVEMMNRLNAMRAELGTLDGASSEAEALRHEIRDLQLKVALRLERQRAA